MSVYPKRGVYHYDFRVNGYRYTGSTGEKQRGRAETYEALIRAEAVESKRPPAMRKVPKLCDYATSFLAEIEAEKKAGHYTENGWLHYRRGVRLLTDTAVWPLRLDQITAGHAARLTFPGNASGNNALRVLRRMLRVAEERGLIHKAPTIKLFEDRERKAVLELWLEELVLKHAREPLRSVIVCMMDSFLRPFEVVAMRWEDILWDKEQVHVPQSKTKAGIRYVGLTARMKSVLESRRDALNGSPWVFPSRGAKSGRAAAGGHLLPGSLNKPFRETKRRVIAEVRTANPSWEWPEGLVLYSARHTGATAFSEEVGWNQMRVAAALGHSDLRTSRRYIHPADDSGAIMDRRRERLKLIEKKKA